MNTYLTIAALLTIAIGTVHSVLGEVIIFSKVRNRGLVPTLPVAPLQARNIRIIWATWHLASVFGFSIAALLLQQAQQAKLAIFSIHAIAVGMLAAAMLVLYATKGRHPGWCGLLGVAVLCWVAVLQN